MKDFFLSNEFETIQFGKKLASVSPKEFIIFLEGNLGAGKTTLVRGFLQGLGVREKIKSPTYTLVEPYQINQTDIYHFDLYRLTDPEALEYLGARDYFEHSICLVEWPENGKGFLPTPDLYCYLSVKNSGRIIRIEAVTEAGKTILKKL